MRKIYFCLLLLLTGLMAQAQPCTTMYVNGRNLYSAAGEKVILRGFNEMIIYSGGDPTGSATFPEIAKTGANTVRICWNSSGSAATLDNVLANCIANKMIPMVQLNDLSLLGDSGNLITSLPTLLNYWTRADVKTVILKYKKWLLLNIGNEVGGNPIPSDAAYTSAYISAVQQLRTAGYTMPLVIDAAGWGQQESFILNNWQTILQADSQKSLLFSLHPYWKDTNISALQTRFTNLVNAVVTNNIPFILGEGPQATGYDCNTSFPYSWAMQQCQNNQIGWLVWTWGKVQDGTGGSCGTTFDVTTNGVYGSWANPWGQAVALTDLNSIKNTSVRPSSLTATTLIDVQAPSVPPSFASLTTTASSAVLNWGASTDNVGVTGYVVYSGPTALSTTPATSLTLTNLACNTSYTLTVRAQDCAGNLSAVSNTVIVTTAVCPTPPAAPTNLVATNVTANGLLLNWMAPTGTVTGYQIFQNGTQIGTATGTTYNVSNLTCGTAYSFAVKAYNAASASANSNTVTVTTTACPAGEIIYADALNTNWQDWSYSAYRYNVTTPKAEGTGSLQVDFGGYGAFAAHRNSPYTVPANGVIKFWAYSTGANSLAVSVQATDNSSTSPAVIVTTVANQWQEFTIDMAALGNPATVQRLDIKNNSGNSPTVYFDYIRFDVKPVAPQPPAAPANLVASNVTANSLTLNWTAPSGTVTGYQIFQNGGQIGTATATTYNVTSLACGTGYLFTVKALNAVGTSASSNTVSVTTEACLVPPTVPIFLTTTNVTSTSLLFGWTAPAGIVTGYRVYQNGVLVATTANTSFPATGLVCNTPYSFMVQAYNSAGTSPNSSITWVTTLPCLPGSPTNLVASNVTANGVSLAWTAATGTVSGYQIFQNGGLLMTTIGTNMGLGTLSCNTTYTFTVKAYNATGVSVSSNTVTIKTAVCPTLPGAPTNLAASNIGANGLTLNWTAASGTVTGYQVFQNGTVIASTSGTTWNVSGLACNTAYPFVVKAYNAAGSTSSNTVSPITLACSTNLMIYSDALNADWIDMPWPTSPANYANTSPAIGTKSIKITMQAWDALSIGKKSALPNAVTSSATVLQFKVYTTTPTTLMVYLSDISTANNANGPYFTTNGAGWQTFNFPISQLSSSGSIRRIQFKNFSANTITCYFDDIQLLSLTAARIIQPAAVDPITVRSVNTNMADERQTIVEPTSDSDALTVFPNPSSGPLTIRYHSQQAETVQIQVVDLLGRVVRQQSHAAQSGQNIVEMNVETAPIGLYLLRLQRETGQQSQKIEIIR